MVLHFVKTVSENTTPTAHRRPLTVHVAIAKDTAFHSGIATGHAMDFTVYYLRAIFCVQPRPRRPSMGSRPSSFHQTKGKFAAGVLPINPERVNRLRKVSAGICSTAC